MTDTSHPIWIGTFQVAGLPNRHPSTIVWLVKRDQWALPSHTPGGYARLEYAAVVAVRDSLRQSAAHTRHAPD